MQRPCLRSDTWITNVSIQSTYTAILSKNNRNFDILWKEVDAIDTRRKYVDKMLLFRHILAICRFHRQEAQQRD